MWSSSRVLLVVGGYLVDQGSVTIGELVAFVLYVGAFFGPIQELVGLYNMYQQGVASVVKLDEILRTDPSVTENPLARDLPEVQGRIAFEHVDFAYRDGGLVLLDIDFELEPGEVVAFSFDNPDADAMVEFEVDGSEAKQINVKHPYTDIHAYI